MTKKKPLHLLPPILATLCAAVLVVAYLATGRDPSDANTATHADPDPSTDLQQVYAVLLKARDEGDVATEEWAWEAIRQDTLSRMTPSAREDAEQAPPVPVVPPGTVAYVAPEVPRALVKGCEGEIQRHPEPLCEMVILHAEGKVRSGAFTRQQQAAVLESAE